MTGDDQPIRDVRVLLSGARGRLACGMDADELLEQAADGYAGQLTGHQQECPHCQAALQEFSRVWEPVRRLASEPVAIPAAVKAAVFGQLRDLVSDVWYTLQVTDDGAIRIAARVVAAIARRAAQKVPGVGVAFGRSTRSKAAGLAEQSTLGHRHQHS